MEAILASVCTFGFDFIPRGWLPCEGQLLRINSYQSLFSLLGTTWGGDGRATFGLPDLRSAVPVGADVPTNGGRVQSLPPATVPARLRAIGVRYAICVEGTFPSRGSGSGRGYHGWGDSGSFLASVTLFAGNFVPVGWLACDGALLPINDYQALFALIGTVYGGDGRSTFKVPDLRGRVPVGVGFAPGLPSYSLGQQIGVASETGDGPNKTVSLVWILSTSGTFPSRS